MRAHRRAYRKTPRTSRLAWQQVYTLKATEQLPVARPVPRMCFAIRDNTALRRPLAAALIADATVPFPRPHSW